MISPNSELVRSPPPSTTITSPGCAMSIALWIIRLSPGRRLHRQRRAGELAGPVHRAQARAAGRHARHAVADVGHGALRKLVDDARVHLALPLEDLETDHFDVPFDGIVIDARCSPVMYYKKTMRRPFTSKPAGLLEGNGDARLCWRKQFRNNLGRSTSFIRSEASAGAPAQMAEAMMKRGNDDGHRKRQGLRPPEAAPGRGQLRARRAAEGGAHRARAGPQPHAGARRAEAPDRRRAGHARRSGAACAWPNGPMPTSRKPTSCAACSRRTRRSAPRSAAIPHVVAELEQLNREMAGRHRPRRTRHGDERCSRSTAASTARSWTRPARRA